MKKPITSLLTFVFLVPFLIPSASAFSEETNECVDRVYGYVYSLLSDYEISDEMTSDIENFCLTTNVLSPYSTLVPLAQASRNIVESFFALTVTSTYRIYELSDALYDSGDFSSSSKASLQTALDQYHTYVVNRRFEINDIYTDEDVAEYPYLQTDVDNVQAVQSDFLDAYDEVSASLDNNYVCSDGYSSDSSCSCFDGYEWATEGFACVEAAAVIVETIEDIQVPEEVEEPESIFDDMTPSDDNYEAISYLKDNGIIGGYSDGTFRPDNALNRAELLKILVEGKGISPDSSQYANCFPDVTTDWYAKYVCYAKEQGWIEGYPDNTFRPATSVNKVEAIKMLLEVFGEEAPEPSSSPFSDVPVSEWYAKYVAKAEELGLLEETSLYSPSSYITRGGVSENIYRLLIQL